MLILLDTHILLWVISTPERVSGEALSVIKNPANEVLFSAVNIWEIAIKSRLGYRDFIARPDEVLVEALDIGFIELPIYSRAAAAVATLPPIHRDPFDRLLIAQAIVEPAILYTADAHLPAYSDLVRRIEA
jgi:PIN domain nuclease of toxin-antitoxin system